MHPLFTICVIDVHERVCFPPASSRPKKIPAVLLLWRATLELWPHLDAEHLWNANNYPISAKRGCSCSPYPRPHLPHRRSGHLCFFLPAPSFGSGESTSGGVAVLWKGGEEVGTSWGSVALSWLTKLRQKGPSLAETDGPAHTHLDGQGNHKKAWSASKPLCHLGSSLGIKGCVCVCVCVSEDTHTPKGFKC